MNPHHDRQMGCGIHPRRPNIEKEAVFAIRSGSAAVFFRYVHRLQARFAEDICPTYTSPRAHGLGLAPAEVADRRSRVGNSLEYEHAALGYTLEVACLSPHDRDTAAGCWPGDGKRVIGDGPEQGHHEHAEDNDTFHR
jgi:hypothetical protein